MTAICRCALALAVLVGLGLFLDADAQYPPRWTKPFPAYTNYDYTFNSMGMFANGYVVYSTTSTATILDNLGKVVASLNVNAAGAAVLMDDDRSTVFMGNMTTYIMYAYQSDGTQVWSISDPTGQCAMIPLATSTQVLVVQCNQTTAVVLNKATGQSLWSFDFGYQYGSSRFVAGSSDEDKIFISDSLNYEDTQLIGFTGSSGDVLFNISGGFSSLPPASYGGKIVLSNGSYLCALNTENGSLEWTSALEVYSYDSGVTKYSPGLNGVLAASYGSITLINYDTGATVWKHTSLGQGPITLTNTSAFASLSPSDVSIFSGTSGAPIWSLFPIGVQCNYQCITQVSAMDHYLAIAINGELAFYILPL